MRGGSGGLGLKRNGKRKIPPPVGISSPSGFFRKAEE